MNDTVPTNPDPMAAVRGHVADLPAQLALWVLRDSRSAGPETSRAGSDAVASIDAVLLELHQLRGRLMSEVRQHQDECAARTDALLAEIKARREGITDSNLDGFWPDRPIGSER